MNDLKIRVRKFIVENFLFGEDDGFGDGVSFLEKGIIDSTGILELITWIEETFGTTVQENELIPENFDSIDNIAAYLQRKIQAETVRKTA